LISVPYRFKRILFFLGRVKTENKKMLLLTFQNLPSATVKVLLHLVVAIFLRTQFFLLFLFYNSSQQVNKKKFLFYHSVNQIKKFVSFKLNKT